MQNDSITKYNQILLAILLTLGLLYLGRPFLIPLAIGALLAILMIPACKQLEKWRISRSIASLLCVLILLLLFTALTYFMTGQITGFARDLPSIKNNLDTKLDNIHRYVDDTFGMPQAEQEEVLDSQVNTLFQRIGSYITLLMYNMGSFLMDFFIVALYCYFFLSYRQRFKTFVIQLITRRMERKTDDIFSKISTVGNAYITGVALVVLILAICNTIALSIIGLQQALFFGVLAGLLNIIPFIGSMVGSAIPILVLLLTRDGYAAPIAAAIYFLGIQLVESYFLTPNITGNKVKLNPMATIMALLMGALVWGVAGMILFIPFLGILKVVFDNIDPMQPYGYVVGNEDEGS